jgi:hypothetical protein
MRSITRAGGLLAGLVICALGLACGDPELSSDLDSAGPPDVLEVNVANETAPTDTNGNAVEAATYCRGGEEFKVSTFYCPEERDETDKPIPGARDKDGAVTDGNPIDPDSCVGQQVADLASVDLDLCTGGWNTRFIFSELLDPDIEQLIDNGDGTMSGSLDDSQPFTVTCNDVEVPYGGWYEPSGNAQAFPAGPSLLMKPNAYVATGSSCEVALVDDKVTDKDGDLVPSDQLGPYGFTVAPLHVLVDADGVPTTNPANATEGVDPASTITIPFNAPITLDPLTLADHIVLTATDDPATPILLTFAYSSEAVEDSTDLTVDPTAIVAAPDALAANTNYTVTVSAGSAGITDIADGPLVAETPVTFSFTTGEAP